MPDKIKDNKCLIFIPNNANYIEILGHKIDGFDSFELFCEHLKKFSEMEETINRLQAEIERLNKCRKEEVEKLMSATDKVILETKAEAYKEFAERLKEKYGYYDWENKTIVYPEDEIDNLLKELVGDNDG